MALAAVLGTIVHGFTMSATLHAFIWHPIYILLGILVTLLFVAFVYDVWGEASARRILPVRMDISRCCPG
ncbi:MAG: hypothetical protein JXC33_08805 [Deltaproteobacteria bacterium]|nr:hypothetical protein [Deltaproteobacteria bacterium]